MTRARAVYEGWIRHRRFEPVEHAFRYRLFLMYLDLGELPEVLDPTRSARPAAPRPGPLPPRATSWATRRGRSTSARATPSRPRPARRPAGPVRLLAGLRYLGHSFNPVSFYYCFDSAGERVEAVVADVENIPWGERHPYVLARGERRGTVLSDELDKTLPRLPADGDGPDLRLPRHASPASASPSTSSRARASRRGVGDLAARRQDLRRDPLAAPPRAQPAAR